MSGTRPANEKFIEGIIQRPIQQQQQQKILQVHKYSKNNRARSLQES